MKKFFKLTTVVLAAFMFAACSSEELAGGQSTYDPFNADGDGFMQFSLGLPSARGTRANTDFNDGDPKEYQVENITLVLFSGANENDAVLRSAYNLSDQTSKFGADGQAQVTSNAKIVAAINRTGIGTTENIYAFVILNDHQFYHVASNAAKTTTTLYMGANGGGGAELTGMKFEDFRKLELNETGRDYSHQSFFMSNVPVAVVPGGNNEISNSDEDTHTLVTVDRQKIYASKSQAEAGEPAAIINVERALAKITVTFDLDTHGATSGTITDGTLNYDMMNWIIDNTNPYTYVTRNFRKADYNDLKSAWPITYANAASTLTDSKYRFVSKDFIDDAESVKSYRTFWAVDANYEGVSVDPSHDLLTEYDKRFDQIVESKRNNKDTYYCTENTFNVQNQSEKNTTRLVVSAKFNDGHDFYTMEENATTLYQVGTGNVSGTIGHKIYEILSNRVNLTDWMSKFKNPDWEDPVTAADFLKISFAPNPGVAGVDVVTVTFNDDSDAAIFTDKEAAKAEFLSGGATSLKTLTDKYLDNEFTFYHYVGGLAYYTALVKHFGVGDNTTNCEAPWIQSQHEGVENSTAGVYVGKNATDLSGDYMNDWSVAEKNYLGRYGIVRNNWYDIKVTGVRAIGSSVIPNITNSDVPDDQVKNYISVKINITPWVLRTQNVVL